MHLGSYLYGLLPPIQTLHPPGRELDLAASVDCICAIGVSHPYVNHNPKSVWEETWTCSCSRNTPFCTNLLVSHVISM